MHREKFNVCFVLLVLCILCRASVHAVIHSQCKSTGHVLLSFDYGPSQFTGRLLDILAERNVSALFHVSVEVLRNATMAEYVQRAANEGHTIGIFVPDAVMSFSSPSSAALALSELQQGTAGNGTAVTAASSNNALDPDMYAYLAQASNWISTISGRMPSFVRFGRRSTSSVAAAAAAAAMSASGVSNAHRKTAEALGLQITKARLDIRDESNRLDAIWNSFNRGFNSTVVPSATSFIVRQKELFKNSVGSVERMIEMIRERGFTIVNAETCIPPHDKTISSATAKDRRGAAGATLNSKHFGSDAAGFASSAASSSMASPTMASTPVALLAAAIMTAAFLNFLL